MCGVLVVAGLAALAMLGQSLARRPQNRLRAAGFVALAGGALLVGLAVGWSRGGLGPTAGLAQRYVLPATVLPVVLYLSHLAVPGSRVGAALRWTLMAALVFAAPNSYRIGLAEAGVWRVHLREVAAAAAGGLPPDALATRYWERLIRHRASVLAERLRELQGAGLPPFAGAAPPLAVTVRPFATLERLPSANGPPRPRPALRKALGPGDWWEQPLPVPRGMRPYRIDLMLVEPPGDLPPDTPLRWILEARREGHTRVLGHGSAAAVTADGYVVIAFPAAPTTEGSEIVLKVGWPPAARPGELPSILLFRRADAFHTASKSGGGGLSLRGFIYLAVDPADGASAPLSPTTIDR
jgi:hypothetical protein